MYNSTISFNAFNIFISFIKTNISNVQIILKKNINNKYNTSKIVNSIIFFYIVITILVIYNFKYFTSFLFTLFLTLIIIFL